MLRFLLRSLLFGARLTSAVSSRHRGRPSRELKSCETLETRLLLSATTIDAGQDTTGQGLVARPLYIDENSASPLATSGPTGYTPDEIRNAYGFDNVSFANGAIAGDGSGTTIAIVDAYDDPNIASDLHQFDAAFGLPDPVLTKVNQNGGTNLPAGNKGWAGEIALDVEWAHAIAPKAKILLVEANSDSLSNLTSAVDYARRASGVDVVSMSWGSNEFSAEKSYDSLFTTPSGHNGVTFLASSGDAGAPVGFPAISPNVVGVGGTSLSLNTAGNYSSESGWSGSGGGISAYESQPAYQQGVVTQSTTRRTSPDVAYDADPNTGFAVYDSYGNSAARSWEQVGGTSAASPQWAGLVAIADQGRALSGLGSLDGATQTLPKIYSMASSDFHDVTSGSSSGSPNYTAKSGYDMVTGRGTPVANLVIRDLVGTSSSSTPTTQVQTATHFSVSVSTSTNIAGSSFSITVTALDASNSIVTGYTGSIHLSSSDLAGILPADYTFTIGDKGTHTFSDLILKTAATETVTVTDKANGSLVGNTAITITPAAATHLAFLQSPTSVASGATISPAVKVEVLDAYNNIVVSDNQHVVSIAIGVNPSSGVLSGTHSVTVSSGIATFSSLSINQLGNGYSLVATASGLSSATSAPFNVATPTRVIENFDDGNLYEYTQVGGGYYASVGLSAIDSHDGNYGLVDYSGSDWIYRDDTAAQVKQGDTISVWMAFVGSATGIAAFGFGASGGGTLSLVASPFSNQLLLMNDVGYGATTLGAAKETFQTNHWYRMEVTWGTSGNIVGRIYDSNGTTLLQTVTGATNAIKSGGIAFKANGGNAVWDTVQVTSGASQTTNATRFSETSTVDGGPGTQSTSVSNESESDGTQSIVVSNTPTNASDATFINFGGFSSELDNPVAPESGHRNAKTQKRSGVHETKVARRSKH
jgi:hypothetical protein